ncbi:cupin domain-containing protein [Okeania sp. SIO2B9]|uniref:cupin domain-containing protein n=1 Tax=Okeania sp. SIO2B9 TaxID=2607782 RepID=UPI001429A0AB|nr:cupin domain-containing protein [Okeania sp. SIO2B9]NES87873.1 cupin domain-containing protein [Okeania sp. SIO2B9]
MSTKNASYWIEKLGLTKHPEGGYYKETYRCEEKIAQENLPKRFEGDRSVATAIYFLLEGTDFSALHRLESDELWHFYAGTSLTVHVIEESGNYYPINLGDNFEEGEVFQALVKAGSWFGSTVNDAQSYALVDCTVHPGFDFNDFELAKQEELTKLYPQHQSLIEKMTRI